MRTIALRMKEQYAPVCGTVEAHQKLIDQFGYVWYGKMGPAISDQVANEIMWNKDPMILLFQVEDPEYHWAHVLQITKQMPPEDEIPVYYRGEAEQVGTWFQIDYFKKAGKDVMSKYHVVSTGNTLENALRQRTSPYFVIES